MNVTYKNSSVIFTDYDNVWITTKFDCNVLLLGSQMKSNISLGVTEKPKYLLSDVSCNKFCSTTDNISVSLRNKSHEFWYHHYTRVQAVTCSPIFYYISFSAGTRLLSFSINVVNPSSHFMLPFEMKQAYLITVTSWWPRWRLKSPASPLFTQPFIRMQIKENIKAPRHWPLCGEFTGDQWIPRTDGL